MNRSDAMSDEEMISDVTCTMKSEDSGFIATAAATPSDGDVTMMTSLTCDDAQISPTGSLSRASSVSTSDSAAGDIGKPHANATIDSSRDNDKGVVKKSRKRKAPAVGAACLGDQDPGYGTLGNGAHFEDWMKCDKEEPNVVPMEPYVEFTKGVRCTDVGTALTILRTRYRLRSINVVKRQQPNISSIMSNGFRPSWNTVPHSSSSSVPREGRENQVQLGRGRAGEPGGAQETGQDERGGSGLPAGDNEASDTYPTKRNSVYFASEPMRGIIKLDSKMSRKIFVRDLEIREILTRILAADEQQRILEADLIQPQRTWKDIDQDDVEMMCDVTPTPGTVPAGGARRPGKQATFSAPPTTDGHVQPAEGTEDGDDAPARKKRKRNVFQRAASALRKRMTL